VLGLGVGGPTTHQRCRGYAHRYQEDLSSGRRRETRRLG